MSVPETTEKLIHELIAKACKADMPTDAMLFSQAASNAANALAVLANIKREGSPPQ